MNLKFWMLGLISMFLFVSCKPSELEKAGALVPLTVDENPALASLEVNGTKLHLETWGNPTDPILLCTHGGPGGDHRSLLGLKELAIEGYYVIIYTQRGAGLSRRHPASELEFEDYLADHKAILEHFRQNNTQQIILYGHSWGAMLTSMYLDSYMEDVDAVILDEPGGLSSEQLEEYMGRFVQLNLMSENLENIVWSDQFITGDDHEVLDYKAAVMMYNMPGDDGSNKESPVPFWRLGGIAMSTVSQVPEYDWTTRLDQFEGKVLYFNTEWNPAQPDEYVDRLAAPFNDVTRYKMMGVGHDAHYQHQEEYLTVIRDWLSTL